MTIPCSVGVFAHDEEANIGYCLEGLLGQRTAHVAIREIVVVASGCRDRTEEIVRSFLPRDGRLRLLVQPRREGKASAINLFLRHASEEICVFESGDTVPEEEAVERLVRPFVSPRVGMTGAHPIPLNGDDTFIGHLVNLNWRLTHALALRAPRLGELVAVRRVFDAIPGATAVDEAAMEALVREAGLEIVYVPDAIVRNKGPERVASYIVQCRRMYCGHLWLEREQGYRVSSRDLPLVLSLVWGELGGSLRSTLWTLGGVAVEGLGRLLGMADYHILKKNPVVWEEAKDTKRLHQENIYLP